MAHQERMERSDSVVIPPQEQESVVQHVVRSTKNGFFSCFGCLQTSKEKTLIKYKEYEIEQRKKMFGVAYINFKKQGQDDQLPNCVESALKDIENFESEIRDLKTKIEVKDAETKNRLVPAPGTPAATSTSPAKPENPAAPPETAMVHNEEVTTTEEVGQSTPSPPTSGSPPAASTEETATETKVGTKEENQDASA